MAIISEPGFETVINWIYSEVDTNNVLNGEQSTIWKTEGTYSYGFGTNGTTVTNDYAQIKQSINIPANFWFLVDAHQNGPADKKMQILVDTTVLWEKVLDGGVPSSFIDQYIDLSSYSGVHDLIFRLLVTNGRYASGPDCQFDNIRELMNDVYVNSSTGNDTYAGDSCVAGHPVQTFARAYSILKPGGTIHVCNSGADFSGETVTLNKSFSVDLNGTSGYFYMPKAS